MASTVTAERAWRGVFLGARNPALGEAAAAQLRAADGDVRFLELDVARADTLRAACAVIGAAGGRLDVLVNNAGIADPADGPPGKADIAAVRRVMEINFFGPLAVTQAMLALLRRSASGRIVNVSSGLGSLTFNSDPDFVFATTTVQPAASPARKVPIPGRPRVRRGCRAGF